MRDLSPEQVASRQLDELLNNQKLEMDRSYAVSQRWVLWLAIGNGAALAAVGAKLLDAQSEVLAALLMPSCWFFFVGLVCAGAVGPITIRRHEISLAQWRKWTVAFRKGEALQAADSSHDADAKLYKIEAGFEWASAVSFVLGAGYPLTVLCLRYLTSGHGFFPPA